MSKIDLTQCLKCDRFWYGDKESVCPHCSGGVHLPTELANLPTYRPVRLEFGVAMHRDVTPNESGWVKREDLLAFIASITEATPS